ncbi:threonine aldolase family protein [Sphingomonas montanisoli]|uniref:Low specificity L-threonine aldolase n=1 Tax=Sphingomonas montanisoli TaxID=2606412 RepID=A0A5D9C3J9_9SPHN|nr:beta-eliminating lyase-related protein [Sphingomonas montanisoli]TZG26428.1 low specificity L-threonine aldolase [Sphingomonas montanisoli]
MRFFSDNAASVCPEVLDAIARANAVDTAYDGDALSKRLDGAFSDLFETQVAALWIATGTAANSLALASLVQPYQGIVTHEQAHIQEDECGAPEFYTGGAKLMLVGGEGAKLTPEAVTARVAPIRHDVHQTQPAALSITNATEYGLTYSPAEVGALGDIAKARGWGFHMDGARFANAVASTGASPADLTWRGGVDVLSFGFVKNGGMSAEALIFFRPELAAQARYRRKRGGHLFSKGRFAAAQILAMIDNDIWLRNARAANTAATRVADAAHGRLVYPVQANELFVRVSSDEAARLRAQGFDFYDWAPGEIRLVTSWDQPAEQVEALAAAVAAL